MQGQEFDICDLPFDGYYAPQVERKYKPWGCPLSRHHDGHGAYHDGKHGFGPFGRPGFDHGFGPFGRPGFDHGPGNSGFQGRDHHRFGPQEDGHRRHGCGRWGPPKREGDGNDALFHGPPGFKPGHDARPHDFHGHGAGSNNFGPPAWWFGRRGASESAERPSGGPWGGPDHHRP